MRRCLGCWSLVAVTLTVAGCSGGSGGSGVYQQPLGSRATHPSLVLGQQGAGEESWVTGRRDENGEPIPLYRGAGGRLYYKDGSPINFDSVMKQLQDLQTEQRISTVR